MEMSLTVVISAILSQQGRNSWKNTLNVYINKLLINQCDYKIAGKGNLIRHINVVLVTYSCNQCKFKARVTYSCNECEYKLAWKGNLKCLIDS